MLQFETWDQNHQMLNLRIKITILKNIHTTWMMLTFMLAFVFPSNSLELMQE